MTRADIAIIGLGPGGYVAALRAAQLGARVVCVEREYVGGVCLNVGCIPTKALLRSAEVLALTRDAAQFGVMVDAPRFDWSVALERKAAVTRQMVNGVRLLLDRVGVEIIEGEASFLRPDTLAIRRADGQETLAAENVIIATGSRPMQAPIPGLDGPRVIDSTGALSLEELPESLCVIGGGAIGLEFASLFHTVGVKVTVVEMLPRLAPLMDESIGEGLAWTFEQQGIEVITGGAVQHVEQDADHCRVIVATAEGERTVECALVLSAIGRAPNIEGLGLEVLGIKPDRKGIQVDRQMRTVVPGVFAIGDVAADGPMLAHVASHQGIVAVENALGHVAAMDYDAIPNCIFTLPEAAGVGLTEEQARAAGHEVEVGVFSMANLGKAIANGDTNGFVKVVSESRYGAVLGLHVLGPHASDLVLEGTLAVGLEATLDEIGRTVHPHPTLGEAIAEAALAARGRALHLPKRRS
ncbi:MAG TPA: dihydrolipoyl dehydrogenase [Chloroflexi bacterium]|jgi:dihydrolipoamide dehydrogenase|nr:dihydrolipoyl dehydrogenase [Chloroflexota bacterium]